MGPLTTTSNGRGGTLMLLMLEDDPERIQRFQATLLAIAPSMPLMVWRSAGKMIREIEPFLPYARLISLDHSDVEEARVLSVHGMMHDGAIAVAMILRRLNHPDLGIGEDTLAEQCAGDHATLAIDDQTAAVFDGND